MYTFYCRHPKGHPISLRRGLTKKEAETLQKEGNRRRRKMGLKCTYHVVPDERFDEISSQGNKSQPGKEVPL